MNLDRDPKTRNAPKDRVSMTAQWFADDQIQNRLAPFIDNDKHQIFKVAEDMVDVPTIGECRQELRYVRFKEPQPDHAKGELKFFYFLGTHGHDRIAEMSFLFSEPHRFDLAHRIVENPHERSGGIGTELLTTAEKWFAQLAKAGKSDITLTLSTKQPRVMKWIAKNGFAPIPDDVELYNELLQHPERFDTGIEPEVPEEARERVYRKTGDGSAVTVTFEKRIGKEASFED